MAITIAKYGIPLNNIYNFDEMSFLIGMIAGRIVITGSERRGNQNQCSLGTGNGLQSFRSLIRISGRSSRLL